MISAHFARILEKNWKAQLKNLKMQTIFKTKNKKTKK